MLLTLLLGVKVGVGRSFTRPCPYFYKWVLCWLFSISHLRVPSGLYRDPNDTVAKPLYSSDYPF